MRHVSLLNYAANTGNLSVYILWKVTHNKCLLFLSAPGVRDQVLHSVPHSGHAEGSLRSYEEGEIPDAGDDVRSGTGAPAEGEKEEWAPISPRVALAFHPHVSTTRRTPKTPSPVNRSCPKLVWLQALTLTIPSPPAPHPVLVLLLVCGSLTLPPRLFDPTLPRPINTRSLTWLHPAGCPCLFHVMASLEKPVQL